MNPEPLSSLKVVITGASDGIGLALARLYSLRGDIALVCTGSRPADDLPDDFPKNATYFQIDQTEIDCADKLVAKLESHGWAYVDKVFLVAGYGLAISALDETPQNIERTLQINLGATISIVHALSPMLMHDETQRRTSNPTLCLIGSTAHKGAKGFASYAASKAGLDGFGRALQSEWKDRVNVQTIHPGPVATNMHAKAGLKLGFVRKFFAHPDDMAQAIEKFSNKDQPKKTLSFGFAMGSNLLRLSGIRR